MDVKLSLTTEMKRVEVVSSSLSACFCVHARLIKDT